MSRMGSLLKNTGILLIAKISTQIVNFFLLPLYTSLLTTDEYGRVDIYTTLQMILIPFITLQIEMAFFRFFISEQECNKKKIATTSGRILLFSYLLNTILYLLVLAFFHIEYPFLLYFYYLSLSFSTVLLQVCRAFGDNTGYGIGAFICSALSIILNVVFIVFCGYRTNGILLATVIAHALGSGFMLLRTKVYKYIERGAYTKDYRNKLLNYSVPLIFNQIASWTINYSDRIIILGYLGEGINGIYSAANKFSGITNTFFGVYNIAWTENIIRTMNDKDSNDYISTVFSLSIVIYAQIITIIINLLPFTFSFLIKNDFVSSYYHIPILLLSMLFSGIAALLGSIYIAYNKTKEVSITTIIAGIINVLVHLLLIHSCQLFAASVSTLVAFLTLFLYRMIRIKRIIHLQLQIKKYGYQLIILFFSIVAYYNRNIIICLFAILCNCVYSIYLFQNHKQVLRDMLRK